MGFLFIFFENNWNIDDLMFFTWSYVFILWSVYIPYTLDDMVGLLAGCIKSSGGSQFMFILNADCLVSTDALKLVWMTLMILVWAS